MAFLNQGGAATIFLEIGDKTKPKLVRPLAKSPICIWGHNVQSADAAVQVNGAIERVRLRDYHYESCTALDRRGTGCVLCNSVDTGWQYLDPKNQTNKKGQRVDFGKKPVYLLPVWSYADQAIKILRGGNQVYATMDEWDTQGKNIMDCDWMIWKEQIGQKREQIEYKSSRQDSCAFTQSVTSEQVEQAMKEAATTYLPLPQDKLAEKVRILSVEEATQRFLESKARSNPALSGAPTQAALPAASPFGAAPTSGMPAAALPQLQLPPASTTVAYNGPIPPQAGASTATPVVDDSPPPGIPPAMWAILTPDQKAALKPASTGVAPSGPLAQAPVALNSAPAVVAPAVPTTPVQPTTTFTPVPVTLTPVVQPQAVASVTAATSAPAPASAVVSQPVPTATSPSNESNPGDLVLTSGKYSGKRLGDVAAQDPGYLKFFRSTQKDPAVVAAISAVLDAKPTMPTAVVAQTPAPVPATQVPATVSALPKAAAAAPAAQPIAVGADEKAGLVQDCRQLISSITEFKGAGMGNNLVPFLRTNFGRFDYTSWEVPDLQKLKLLLLHRNGGQIPASLQIANP